MEADQLNSYTATEGAHNYRSIGVEDLREAYDSIRRAGRVPVFHPHPLLEDNIFHGELVDWLLMMIRPGYDPKIHKGFLVPERYRELIEGLFG